MADLSNAKGIERGRANFAYICAKEGQNCEKLNICPQFRDKKYKSKEYRPYVKKIPMMIKTNGLGATLAFMYSKKGTYELIGEHILKWLKQNKLKIIVNIDSIQNFNGLPNEVVKLDSEKYRALTVEVLSFFSWLRRFAEGLIESED